MELSLEQTIRIQESLTQIRAALTTMDKILQETDPDAPALAAWVREHLIPAPGRRVLFADARNQAARDLLCPVGARALSALVSARRFKTHGRTYLLDVALA